MASFEGVQRKFHGGRKGRQLEQFGLDLEPNVEENGSVSGFQETLEVVRRIGKDWLQRETISVT